jgi:hypothetical protein
VFVRSFCPAFCRQRFCPLTRLLVRVGGQV